MRAAVPSSIQLLMMSAPIGDVLIIVAHTADVTFSTSDAGGTAHPRRRPGNRLFDRLVMKIVRSGSNAASGSRSGDRNP